MIMTNPLERPSWDEYFMDIAILTSKRSNCIKRSVGCVIVKGNKVVSLGYNGTPCGIKNCFEGGCERCCNPDNASGSQLDLCVCLHAEENALLIADYDKLNGSTLYVTLLPCISCSKKIIQCQVSKIVYLEDYNSEVQTKSIQLLQQGCVNIEKFIR